MASQRQAPRDSKGGKMSLKHEQYWALKKARDFLRDLMDSKRRPKTVKEMKERAYSCLRHYPFLKEDGEPMFSKH